MRVGRATILLLSALGLVACAQDTTTGPPSELRRIVDSTVTSGGDTVRVFTGAVRLSGQVLGVSAVVPVASSRDSLRFEPIAGARIRVMRNILVDSAATQVLVAETTSGRNGEYVVERLEAGYYIAYVTAPEGSAYVDNWSYVPANAGEVRVNVYLWRKEKE
jgi:hypothetical protein